MPEEEKEGGEESYYDPEESVGDEREFADGVLEAAPRTSDAPLTLAAIQVHVNENQEENGRGVWT